MQITKYGAVLLALLGMKNVDAMDAAFFRGNDILRRLNPKATFTLGNWVSPDTKKRREYSRRWEEVRSPKIQGHLQYTCYAHASTMKWIAEQLAERDDIADIYLNMQLQTTMGISSQLRPDILVQKTNGTYFIIEVISESETLIEQDDKVSEMCKDLAPYFDIDEQSSQAIYPIYKTKCSPMLNKQPRSLIQYDQDIRCLQMY